MKKYIVALCVFASTLTAPALATESWDELTMTTALNGLATATPAPGVRVAYIRSPRKPDAAAPAFIVNFVTAGWSQTGAPCINCVVGGATPNLGLPAPYNAAGAGTTMTYSLSLSINSASGTCTSAVSVAAGNKKLYAGTYTLSGLSGGPGTIEVFFSQAPISYTGPAIVAGKLTCNGMTGVVRAPVLFY
jgi:hypothetical protein